MQIAINAWTFPPDMDAAALAGAVVQAGFEGAELTMGADGAAHAAVDGGTLRRRGQSVC